MRKGAIERAIVVGASSGLGAEIARTVVEAGGAVVLLARRGELLQSLVDSFDRSSGGVAHIMEHDVLNRGEVPLLFQEAARLLDGLDTIFYVAGVLPAVAPDEFSTEKDVMTMEVNTLGAIAWLNEAAHRFQEVGSGRIVGISSIAGDRGRRGNPAYCTSKAALNTYLEALRNRLSTRGVKVITVKPGFLDTSMTKGLPGLLWLISAEKAADIVVKATMRGKERLYVPARWWMVGRVVKTIPSFMFRRLNI